jgi:outer membrane protein assembly factor BamB
MLKKILGALVIVAGCALALALYLRPHLELDGSGMRPIYKPQRTESHYAEVEQSRARQTPAPVAEVAERAEVKTDVAAPYWTDFRGPHRDGRYDEAVFALSADRKPIWKQPIGGGYASFVVAEGRAFTIEQRRRQEVVTAYQLATGRELWAHGWDTEFREVMGGDGPRACPTWHDGKVYALGAEGELRCLDAKTGKRIWARNILRDNAAGNLQWGMAAAPLVVDDKLIVLPGGPSGKSVAAYNRLTGEPVWQALDDKASYASPMLVTLAGKRQLLVMTAKRMVGVTVDDGNLIWEYPWATEYDINSAQPLVIGDNRVFVSSGYGHGSAVVEITAAENKFQVRQVWANNRMKNKFSSSVLYKDHIYGLDEAILACISAETGELKWKGGRYGYGQVLLAGQTLIVSTEEGDIVLVEATPEGHHEIGKIPAVSGKTWNVPALAEGYLLVRNATEMSCFKF